MPGSSYARSFARYVGLDLLVVVFNLHLFFESIFCLLIDRLKNILDGIKIIIFKDYVKGQYQSS